jgi:hypothetical protein
MHRQQDKDSSAAPSPKIFSRTTLKLLISIVLASAVAVPVQANTFADLRVGIAQEDNVSKGIGGADIHDDSYFLLEGGVGKLLQIRPGQSVTLGVSAAAQRYYEMAGFDADIIGAQAAYNNKFGLGAYAPTVSLALGLSQEARRGRERDRRLHDLTLSYSKRLSPVWSVYAAVMHEWSEGTKDGFRAAANTYPWWAWNVGDDIFDFTQSSFLASADYTFVNGSTLTASYSFTDGHSVASGLVPNDPLMAISSAIAFDPAFEPSWGSSQATYLITSDTHVYALDWSLALWSNSALDFGYEYRDIQAPSSTSYTGSRMGVTLSWAY